MRFPQKFEPPARFLRSVCAQSGMQDPLCAQSTTASSNRCVGPWGHAAAQGGFRAARSPVTASHQSRAPGHVSGPVAARSRPPRRPRSQIFPQSAQSASKLQCPPHDSLENAVFQKRFGFVWQIPYWNGFGIPRNEFRAAHVSVRKSCAGALRTAPTERAPHA